MIILPRHARDKQGISRKATVSLSVEAIRLAGMGLEAAQAKAKSGDTLVLRIVNSGTVAINVTLDFLTTGLGGAAGSARVPSSYVRTTLASTTGAAEGPNTDNPIWDSRRHAPVVSPRMSFETARSGLMVPPISFEILVFTLHAV